MTRPRGAYWYCAVCGHREHTTRFVTSVTHTHEGRSVALTPLRFADYCRRKRAETQRRRDPQWDTALATLIRTDALPPGEG